MTRSIVTIPAEEKEGRRFNKVSAPDCLLVAFSVSRRTRTKVLHQTGSLPLPAVDDADAPGRVRSLCGGFGQTFSRPPDEENEMENKKGEAGTQDDLCSKM